MALRVLALLGLCSGLPLEQDDECVDQTPGVGLEKASSLPELDAIAVQSLSVASNTASFQLK